MFKQNPCRSRFLLLCELLYLLLFCAARHRTCKVCEGYIPFHQIKRKQKFTRDRLSPAIQPTAPSSSSYSQIECSLFMVVSSSFLEGFLSCFQGDFNNYEQVRMEREVYHMQPKEGGGHEHIHCTLLPIFKQMNGNNTNNAVHPSMQLFPLDMFYITQRAPRDDQGDEPQENRIDMERAVVLAVYYFDGNPNLIFRLRLYTLAYETYEKTAIRMKLYALTSELEDILRQHSLNRTEWVSILNSYLHAERKNGIAHTDESWWGKCFVEMKNCDIVWSPYPDQDRHAYLFEENDKELHDKTNNGYHAFMIHDKNSSGVLIQSRSNAGMLIRVQDEISLWRDHLWINDRGYNVDKTKLIYGNYNGVPYKLKRTQIPR